MNGYIVNVKLCILDVSDSIRLAGDTRYQMQDADTRQDTRRYVNAKQSTQQDADPRMRYEMGESYSCCCSTSPDMHLSWLRLTFPS